MEAPVDHLTKLGLGGVGPTWSDYNALVDDAARNQLLSGTQRDAVGFMLYKWKITANLVTSDLAATFNGIKLNPSQPLYQVFVGDGTVNDQPACIEYLGKGDPRGWIMPANYPPYVALQQIYGKAYPYADRPLWESPAPFLLVTAPDAAEKNLGGFALVDAETRPPFFRTESMWNYNLYVAYVMVTISPYSADPTSTAVLTYRGTTASRWRIQAGLKPVAVADAGLAQVASQELGRIYLVRTPGKVASDQIYIKQSSYWPLRARSALNGALLELIGASATAAAGLDLGLLAISVAAGGAGLATATALVGGEELLAGLLLDNLQSIIGSTSSILFWDS